MATIYINDKPYDVSGDQNLLTACLSLGFNVPYFCWHPALHAVGSCRLCAVKQFRDEKDSRGRIVMSCMTPADHGTRISIDDPEVLEFRRSIIEWLMLNHPHDCPVCDEGGECHLQDMTVMTGHNYRRFEFKKRTFRNQDLGPFLHHEMNRCIQCYRCVRFYRHYAGGRDLNVFGAHDRLYFGRSADGTLENEFSGNLAEVCPTGVFTDKTLRRHFTRKWDLQTAPSICVHCGLGCNTIPGERYGSLRRIQNRYSHAVNGYFLCDRGRFGYEFVNSPDRVRQPLVQGNTATTGDALKACNGVLGKAKGIVGIGSPRASLESNYALRTLVGADNFSMGVSRGHRDLLLLAYGILRAGFARTPSLGEMEKCDAVLVLGEDVPNTAPRAALALRQSVLQQPVRAAEALEIPRWNAGAVRQVIQDDKGPLFIATPAPTRLDDVATKTFNAAPDDIARLGFAVARELDPHAPAVSDLEDSTRSAAQEIAGALRKAERPLVVSGVSSGSRSVLHAAGNVAMALRVLNEHAAVSLIVPECNSLGLAMMGGMALEDAAGRLASGKADTVIVLENDLFRRTTKKAAEEIFAKAAQVVVIDHLNTPFTEKAEVVLSSGTFAESTGTYVSNEGRAQRFYRVMPPREEVLDGWKWIRDLMAGMGRTDARNCNNVDDVLSALARSSQPFRGIAEAFPKADFRILGQRVPRQGQRYSGRTAMLANVTLHEPAPPVDPDSPLAFSMEGFQGQPRSELVARFRAPGWNSIQAVNKFQSEIAGPLRGGDPGLRLLEAAEDISGRQYVTDIPGPFSPLDEGLLIVPLFDVFGSEELSARGPAVAQRAPVPQAEVNPSDAEAIGLADGDRARLLVGDSEQAVVIRVVPGLAKGVAGVIVGLSGTEAMDLPARGRIVPVAAPEVGERSK